MTLFKEIDYIPFHGEQIKLFSKDKSKLSTLSLDIIDTILNKRVTIILAQGPLNITPFISCLYALLGTDKNVNNVIIGLPKLNFSNKYKEYTAEYFSLLYRKYINSVVSDPFFFYKDIFWCKGKINEENNELFDLIVEKYPVHGDNNYRIDYEKAITKKLLDENYNKIPKIVLIPIQHSIPSNILELKNIQFKEKNYNIKDFNPKMIILESINERHFQFGHLINLINKSKILDIKLILHFSWPYLRGLDDFLSNRVLKNNSDVEIFHFGKRFCLESKNKYSKPPEMAISLSLEGNLWNSVYYPENSKKSNISLFILVNQQNTQSKSFKSLIDSYSTIDEQLQDIRYCVKTEKIINYLTKNILFFPTIIDSFLIPSEIKVGPIFDENEGYRYVPIQDYVKINIDTDSNSFYLFQSLCFNIESCTDISRQLRGLRTYSGINKKTLLQIYFIEEIQKVATNIKLLENTKCINEKINIIIPKLHPYFENRKNNFESIKYFLDSFFLLLNCINFPKIIQSNNKIFLKVGTNQVLIFEENSFKNPSQEKIFELISQEKKYPIEISLTKEFNCWMLTVTLEILFPYIKIEDFEKFNSQNKYCKGIDIYLLKIYPDGKYYEMWMSDFSSTGKNFSNSLDYLIKYATKDNNSSSTHQIQLNIEFDSLTDISNSTYEKISHSRLLMPGPIPFQTMSNGELLISQGYDAFLLPFEEIVFFAYPGKNLLRISRQIQLYKDIFSENPTKISTLDLMYSIQQMNKSSRYEFPKIPSIDDFALKNNVYGDSFLDSAVRNELLNNLEDSGDDIEEILTLKEIWSRIGIDKSMNSYGDTKIKSDVSTAQREQINFRIKFIDNTEDNISFACGTLIRKKNGEDYILIQVDDLNIGDEILFIESVERESIDNFLLRDFVQEKGISLETIFEPFFCLRIFYETLNSVKYLGDYPRDKMKKIYWLNETQNNILFKTIQSLFQMCNFADLDILLQDENNIFNKILSSHNLIQIFTRGRKQITYDKLFKIAQIIGITLSIGTFKQYCTFAINEHQHYYFQNEKNLLALGYLIGHQRIIENYQLINSQGREVGTILQIIGRSIARVTRGVSDPFNEMDASIEGKIKRCSIISIILPTN